MGQRVPGLNAQRLVAAAFVVSAWLTSLATPAVPAETLYVASNGSDANPGTLSKPWRTLEHGIDRLSAGDTLLVRGGIYREHELTIGLRGTGSASITIGNYAGEEVILDGSFEEFQEPGNSEWELVDAAVDLYRSKRTYADGDWSGKFEHDGKLYALNEYHALDALASPKTTFDSSGVSYLGPGFFWNSSDKRIYIRLQAPDPNALYGRVFPIPADPDPRQNRVFITHHFFGFKFAGAEHVIIDGINVKHFDRPLYFGSGHDITVRNAVMVAGKTGALLESSVSHVTLEGLTFDAGLPRWIAWSDIKHSPQSASSLKLSGVIIKGDVDGVRIADCVFVDVFDGITAISGPTNLEIVRNAFDIVVDDAMQLGTAASNVEFAYNLMVGVGPSHDASGASLAPGTKYIHHNIIDARTETLYSRVGANNTGWRYKKPFATHGSDYGPDPWKIYNNTILFRKNRNNQGAGEHRAGPRQGPVHEVYNNIFLQLDDWRLSRGARVDDGAEIYDGNLWVRAVSGPSEYFFRPWENDGTDGSFRSLKEFRASSFYAATRSYYAAGWESSGIEADPELRDPDRRDYRPALDGPAAAGGLNLSGKGWPGTSAATYRGAVDSSDTNGLGQVGPDSPGSDSDMTPPSVPGDLKAIAVPAGQVDLSWSAASDDVGVVGYRVYRDGALIASPADTAYADTSLDPGTTYTYAVSALDAAGNESGKSSSVSVTTSGDITPPSAPGDLHAIAVLAGQVDLSWTAASDDVGVVGYRVYRDGGLIASPAGTAYSDTGLNPGTTYGYAVSALDDAGNESAKSNTIQITTRDGGEALPSSDGLVMLGGSETYQDSEDGSTGGSARFVSEGGDDAAVLVILQLQSQGRNGLDAVSAVTYGGQPMTEAAFTGRVPSGTGNPAVSIWVLTNPPVGEHELTWTFDGKTNSQSATFLNLTGIDPFDPIGAVATARKYDGEVLSLPVAVSTTADSSLILGGTAGKGPDANPFRPGIDVLELAVGRTGGSGSRDISFFAGWSDAFVVGDYLFEAVAATATEMATAAIELRPVTGP